MTNQQPENVDTTQYQEEYQLQRDDTLDIALLANVVGKELTQVDKFAVNGLAKATRISQEKIFNKPPSISQPPVRKDLPPEMQQMQQVNTPKPQPAPPPQPQPKQVVHTDIKLMEQLKSIENRLEKIEGLYQDILTSITSNNDQITITLSKNDKD